MVLSNRGIYRWYVTVPITAMLCLAVSYALWTLFGREGYTNEFVTGFASVVARTVNEVTLGTVTLGVFVLMFVVVFSAYGIISVVVAYFRKDYHRILLSMTKPGNGRLKRSALKLFGVPSIIDVKSVTIEPEEDSGRINTDLMFELAAYIMAAGIIISSYLFLNPVFLDTIPFTEMMVILILVSLFICVLIIPVSIIRSLNARAWSDAPRPFVLWKGMKRRMFTGYMFIFIMLTLLWISIYTGVDMVRVFYSYLGYLVFLLVEAAAMSFIYVNAFYRGFRDGIARNFYRALAERDREKDFYRALADQENSGNDVPLLPDGKDRD